MKRVILLILASIFIFAKGKSEILDLKTRVLNGDPEGSAPPRRSPILVPIVDQEGTCFYFEQCNYQNAILQIIKDGVAVYSVTVPTDTNQVAIYIFPPNRCHSLIHLFIAYFTKDCYILSILTKRAKLPKII